MKIMHLTNHVQEIGNGIVNVAVDLAHGQASSGHEVHFGSCGGEYAALLASSGVRHHQLPIPGLSVAGIRSIGAFRRAVSLARPEIVHSHMVKWAGISRLFAGLYRYATVATVHNVYQKSSRVMGGCDAVVALGEASRGIIHAWGVPHSKIHVALNAPLGTPRLPSSAMVEPVAMGGPSIVSIGGLFTRKGFDVLISAFGILRETEPTATLHLVGEGPDRPLFEAMAAKLPTGAVTFHGFRADPRNFIKGADVFVLASLRESFPLVLLEAREFASRIVATDVDGNREALDGGAAGLLVPASDPKALSDGILRALRSPVPEGVSVGLDRYRLPSLVERTLEIYRLASEGRRGGKARG